MKKMERNSRGMGALELLIVLLTVVFITLKLTEVIDWSWRWILAPIWIPIVLVLILVILAILFKRKC